MSPPHKLQTFDCPMCMLTSPRGLPKGRSAVATCLPSITRFMVRSLNKKGLNKTSRRVAVTTATMAYLRVVLMALDVQLTTQAQRPGQRDAWTANRDAMPG